MAFISNGTTVATGGNVEASRLTGTASAINGSNITNLPSPSTDAINAVGSYGFGYAHGFSGSNLDGGQPTISFSYNNVNNNSSNSNSSGTWRAHGAVTSDNDQARTTLFVRIS